MIILFLKISEAIKVWYPTETSFTEYELQPEEVIFNDERKTVALPFDDYEGVWQNQKRKINDNPLDYNFEEFESYDALKQYFKI